MTQITLRLNYQTYFDDSETLENLLSKFKKNELLKAATYLINRAKSEKTAIETINNWFSNSSVKSDLLAKTCVNTSILNVFSSLQLLSYISTMEDSKEDVEYSKDEFEICLFKAYLLLNLQQDVVEEKGQKNLPVDSNERLQASLLTLTYHDYDIQNYVLHEIFLSQLIKSIEFFQFLEKHDILQFHLKYFLNKYNCSNWQDWVVKLLNIILPIITHNNDTYSEISLKPDEDFIENNLFLTLFSIPLKYEELPDFIQIRSNPLLKIDDEKFIIINKVFLVERIFKSVIFEFSLKVNEGVETEKKIKDFRSLYCDFFSEQILLYNITNNCFPKKIVRFAGENFKNQGYSSEPDFYVRIKNKILLFESKDVILKGEEKLSRDYEILSSGLKDKFLKVEKDGKISKKAILQLIENVERIVNKFYTKIDIDYNNEHLMIYPILVIHDRQFDAPNINRILNTWFKEELRNKFENSQIEKVKDLVVINIDTLILYQEHFKKRGLYGLEMIIDKYIESTKYERGRTVKEVEANYLNTSISFSNFCAKYFDNDMSSQIPCFIDNYIKKFKKE